MVPAGRRRPAFASVREAQVGVEHGRSARGSVVTGRLLRVPWVTGAVLAVLAVNAALIVAGADSLPSPARALTQCSSAAPVPPQRGPAHAPERHHITWRRSTQVPPICTLIHVDCLVTADAPNGLICIGQQLGALIPGAMARRELP
jgi:hypothetical protein